MALTYMEVGTDATHYITAERLKLLQLSCTYRQRDLTHRACMHTYVYHATTHIIVFLHIMATYLTYISNACRCFSGVAMWLQHRYTHAWRHKHVIAICIPRLEWHVAPPNAILNM